MQDNQPYVITKKRSVRRVYWGRIAAAVIIICLLVVGGVLFFSRSSGKVVTPEHEYWFVSLGEYSTLGDASSRADSVINAGGAGYLYGKDTYKVTAACYAGKSDALSVSERLESEGETPTVFSVTCSALTLKKPKENASGLKKMLSKPYEIYNELYEVSVKTDTKEITENAAKYAALKMSVTCSDYASESSQIGSEADSYLAMLFSSLALSLDTLARTENNVPQTIKYTLCEIVVKISEYTDEFANKLKNLS